MIDNDDSTDLFDLLTKYNKRLKYLLENEENNIDDIVDTQQVLLDLVDDLVG